MILPEMAAAAIVVSSARTVASSITIMSIVVAASIVSIVSTSKGVMSDANARSQNVGGEVLCTVF